MYLLNLMIRCKEPLILFVVAVYFLTGCLLKFSEKPSLCYDGKGNRVYGETGDLFTQSVYPILQKCSGCHGAGGVDPVNHLHLQDINSAYTSIVNQPTQEKPDALPNILVKPGSLDESYLYQKLLAGPHKEGVRMPQNGILTDNEIKMITDWILAGAQAPGEGNKVFKINECTPCDAEIAMDRNSHCHPCNSENPPAYCVGANYFRDTIMPMVSRKCGGCHNASDVYGTYGNFNLDTAINPEKIESLRNRYLTVYKNMVLNGTYFYGGIYPYYRVAPSDTSGSLMFQAIKITNSQINSYRLDSIPDMYQYKLKSPMPKMNEGRDTTIEDSLVIVMRKWILSGAPGPGDLSKISDTVPKLQ